MQFKVGHTGITWGIPGNVEEAVRDTAELGYQAFETFGRVLDEWEPKGGFGAVLDRHGIPMSSMYCYATWIDPAKTADEIAGVLRQAKLLKGLGGDMVVLQGERKPKGGYSPEQFRRLAEVWNDLGRRLLDVGMRCSIHPHTGTAIETWDDITTILDLIDRKAVFFAPDTGQIAKGGSDIVKVFERYPDLIRHVHLKDWSGKVAYDADGKEIDQTGYVNYEPVGNGVLPMPRLMEILEDAGFDGWLAVELDGTPRAPRPPREAALMSRRYLGQILGDRVAWRRAV